jgi:hypothetical protein
VASPSKSRPVDPDGTVYIDPPDIPVGMTVPEYRRARRSRRAGKGLGARLRAAPLAPATGPLANTT